MSSNPPTASPKEQVSLPKEQMVNYVKEIYAPFTDEEISAKMVELLTPKGTKAPSADCISAS